VERLKLAENKAKREGMKEAEQKLATPLRTALGNLENLLDEISRFRRELFKESEAEIWDFIQRVCKRILMKELSLDPNVLKSIVEKGLEILGKQKKVVVLFNPSDEAFFL